MKEITIKEWVRKLNEEEFPLFAHTARSIASLSADTESSIQELAQVILGDSAMTARVLRMANSAYYNPVGQRINTVSRSIVVLGFEVVRGIALSISLIDTILTGVRHDAALGELVKSFHAAIQAKEFASSRRAPNTEEIFIAALLNRLGSMAFWCFPYGREEMLAAEYSHSSAVDAEKKVLGFTLEKLTSELSKEWHLSTLLMGALSHSDTRDKSVLDIEHGFRLANSVENGWDVHEVREVIREISEDHHKSSDVIREMAYQNSIKAIRMIENFGINIAAQFIPSPPTKESESVEDKKITKDNHVELQLNILRELSTMLSEQVDMNVVLGTVLEGIYRSLDMDRVVLSLIGKGKSQLVAKFVLGEDRGAFTQSFNFSLNKKENIFTHILALNEPLWMDRKMRSDLGPLLTPDIYDALGAVEFFAIPIQVGGKPMGIIYADRSLTSTPLDEHSFLTFRHFCEQANIAFAILGK
ncbi:hypothetical protein A9Q99_16455 [Gammaproteobacteria bacterium 45_16_T64]|nr:hypothetical protein A9Q99_16455 [Gammaproteobacteria bacterium 45_16_T64]